MIRDILASHFERYPLMGPQDAVKLLYQAVYGPGHLIKDRKQALNNLLTEMKALTPDGDEPLYEPVGGGYCRLNLRPAMQRGIPPEDIVDMLCEAAQRAKGDPRALRSALRELQDMAETDDTPFEGIALDVFLIDYEDRRCPPVHHSVIYREAYHPAYRVVMQKRLKDYLAARRGEK